MFTYWQFRLQRWLRRSRRSLGELTGSLGYHLRFNVFGKWRQFAMIRRFATIWWVIILVCLVGLTVQLRRVTAQGLVLQAQPGGSYTEALVGSVKTLNPILPENSVSADANHLVFSGLTRFDTEGKLQPDLAKDWSVSPDGKTYTFHLRSNVFWHDDVPFTAEDVVFTLAAIQNPDTRSPLATSWQGVKVAAPDPHTVVFTLPKAYTPFMDATTVGLLPRHLLENTEPSQMRVVGFNQHPIGTGPYKFDRLDPQAGEIVFKPNNRYYFGKPLIEAITFRLYTTAEKAYEAYSHREVQGVARLDAAQAKDAESLGTLRLQEASVPDEVAAFFKFTSPVFQDKAVRTALTQATNREAVIRSQSMSATPLTSPLVASGLNLSGAPHQPSFDTARAAATLDDAGWQLGPDKVRSKNGQRLELQLLTQANTPYEAVAAELKKEWGKVGVAVNIKAVDAAELQQSYIRTRHYDVLLYGINVGADPDVYAYWDSSQIKDPGLNLSEYSSPAADAALESGRTIQDPTLRSIKYRSFVQAWVNDVPAVMLYSPTYIYGVDTSVHGVHLRKLINPADRFTGIEGWSVRVKAVPAH